MVKENDYRYSIFNRFISIVFLIFVSFSFGITWKMEELRKKNIDIDLNNILTTLNNRMANNIYDMQDKMLFLSHIISHENKDISEERITELLQLFSKKNNIRMIQWQPITWANKEHIITIDNLGIKKTPIKIINHNYIKEITEFPLSLNFSIENISSLSDDQDIVYAGIGVVDKANNFIGSINTGFYLRNVGKTINEYIKNKNRTIYYAIIKSPENKIILQSNNLSDHDQQSILKESENFIERQINENLSYSTKNSNYIISKVKNFPFVLVLGNNSLVKNYQDYLYNLVPYKFELLIILIIICSLIFLFYHSILNPFLILSKAALNISNGNLNTEIPNIYSKEGNALASALEKIKESLRIEKDLVKQVYQMHNTLSLTNLRLENKVIDRTKELENSLEEKTFFLNNLSHEIQTPIQGITNISKNLIVYWQEISEAEKLEIAKQISYSSQSLLSLLNNLLELGKFSKQSINLNLQNCDLVSLTNEVIEECNLLYINNKKLDIKIHNHEAIHLSIDKERIKQSIRNILLNAIKFSSNNNSIYVKMHLTKTITVEGLRCDAVHFSVQDQGIGIPESELSTIFSAFYQGSNAKNRSTGAGLGLTICQEIIRAHHGKIWAENNKDGGATINLIIPLSQNEQTQDFSPGVLNLNHIAPNILVIDDEEICLNSMDLLLYASKYNLVKIKSAQAALKYLKQHGNQISVILVDLMMPDMYGLNFITEIKNDPNLKHIPIILQTSSSDENEVVRAFNMGIFSFIRKPYDKKTLLEEIEKAMHLNKLNIARKE